MVKFWNISWLILHLLLFVFKYSKKNYGAWSARDRWFFFVINVICYIGYLHNMFKINRGWKSLHYKYQFIISVFAIRLFYCIFKHDIWYQYIGMWWHMFLSPRDQRITQDLDRMCDNFSQIFAPIIIAPFTIAYYLYKSVQRSDNNTNAHVISNTSQSCEVWVSLQFRTFQCLDKESGLTLGLKFMK